MQPHLNGQAVRITISEKVELFHCRSHITLETSYWHIVMNIYSCSSLNMYYDGGWVQGLIRMCALREIDTKLY